MRRFRGLFAALLLIAAATGALRAEAPVTVFAAASLKTALDEAAALYREQGGAVQISYAGSSALARQIEYGAPAQVFLSANTAWMDRLDQGGLLAPDSRRDLLANRLVLAGPADSALQIEIAPGMDLAGPLGGGRLAMALVDAVPAGIYGREALQALGIWDSIAPSVAQADNVRAALRLVALGEAPLGIVYETDAAADPRVRILARFDPSLHAPIVYPMAILKDGDTAAARAFCAFLAEPAARGIFLRHGFGLAGGAP